MKGFDEELDVNSVTATFAADLRKAIQNGSRKFIDGKV